MPRKIIYAALLFLMPYEMSYAFLVGVCTHMGQGNLGARDVKVAISALGTKSVRDEVYWDWIEDKYGRFSFKRLPPAILDFFSRNNSDVLSNSIISLGYGHPQYANGGRPITDDSVLGFARYAANVSIQFGNEVGFFEVWNEWNLPTGRGMKQPGKSDDYVRLARATISEIRKTNFHGKVLVGGVGGDWPDWNFTEQIAKSGLLNEADGYSVHLYNFSKSSSPDEMIARLERLQKVLVSYSGRIDYPVYVTEFGWPTAAISMGSTEETASTKISTFLLSSRKLPWLKGVWIYELFDTPSGSNEIERSFGVFKNVYSPKSGYCKVRGAIQLTQNGNFVSNGEFSNGLKWYRFSYENSDYIAIIPKQTTPLSGPTGWHQNSADLCNLSNTPLQYLNVESRESAAVNGIIVIRTTSENRGKENDIFR